MAAAAFTSALTITPDAIAVAFPTLVTSPVRFALVVTLPAVRFAAVPLMFVPTSADGVPRAGVTKVGEVAKTNAPLPVSSLITPASSADVVAAKAESLSVVTTSVLLAGIVVPFRIVVLLDESVVAATVDGLVNPSAVLVMPVDE